MIQNERQYRISRVQAEKFAQALAQMEQQSRQDAAVPALLEQAQRDALHSQLESLRQEMAAYDYLHSGG